MGGTGHKCPLPGAPWTGLSTDAHPEALNPPSTSAVAPIPPHLPRHWDLGSGTGAEGEVQEAEGSGPAESKPRWV